MSYPPAPSGSAATITSLPTSISNSAARPKRRLSNANSAAAFDHSDHEDEDDYSKPRSKRNRGVRATSDGLEDLPAISSEYAAGEPAGSCARGAGVPAPKALSEKDKDARRQARMIRNRNAAQASRDRKKEHTLFLERRVAELEARLNGTQAHPLSISSAYTASSSSHSASPPSKLARSQRSTSVISSVSSSDAVRIADLEEENEVLRTQLHLEQTESARLRARLEAVSSTTSTPFPAFEPTFAFNTADIKPLPQPEELAYVEARERQKRTPPVNIAQIPLPSLPLHDRADASSSSPSSSSSSLMNLDSSRLVAAEAVQLSMSSSSSSSSPSSSSLTRSPSLCASVSSTPSSVASLDLASTPPSTESYLEDFDHLAPPPMWNEWVKSEPDTKDEESTVTSGLAFVDFDFLNEGPVVASC